MSVHVYKCVSVGGGVAACPGDKAYGAGPVLPGRSHIQIRADNIHWENCCRLETAQTTHNAECVLEQLCLRVCGDI